MLRAPIVLPDFTGRNLSEVSSWAAQNKITNGYSDGTFGVGKDVLRKDIVTFLYRYANMK